MTIRAALTALALLATPALAGEMTMDMAKSSPADKAYMRSMDTMMKGMKVKPSGDPDRDFVLMMEPHHQGAIDMAKVELRYGKDPELLKLAGDIVAAQEKEIALMKDWLARNGK